MKASHALQELPGMRQPVSAQSAARKRPKNARRKASITRKSLVHASAEMMGHGRARGTTKCGVKKCVNASVKSLSPSAMSPTNAGTIQCATASRHEPNDSQTSQF